jgi:hypothetical protein
VGTRLVGRIGLVLDDPKGFESAWRSFVPETPEVMHHWRALLLTRTDVERQSNPKLGGSGD